MRSNEWHTHNSDGDEATSTEHTFFVDLFDPLRNSERSKSISAEMDLFLLTIYYMSDGGGGGGIGGKWTTTEAIKRRSILLYFRWVKMAQFAFHFMTPTTPNRNQHTRIIRYIRCRASLRTAYLSNRCGRNHFQ